MDDDACMLASGLRRERARMTAAVKQRSTRRIDALRTRLDACCGDIIIRHYGACAGMDSNPRVGAGGGRDRRGDVADVEEAQGPQEEAPLGAGADEEGRLGWG